MRTAFVVCAQWISLGVLALLVSSWPPRAQADAPAQPAAQQPVQPAVPAKPIDQATNLVHDALVAEAQGKPDARTNFLQQALAVAPDFAPAHWQSGEIHTGDKWTSIDAAAKQDAHSAKLDEYRKLRDQAGATVDEQLNLARWCEKAGLKDQQRAHLMFALELQPNNKEAISKLGLVRFRGRLIPAAQLDDIKAQFEESQAESKEWKSRVDGWRQQLRDHPSDQEVLKQIRAVRDPAAIFALERGLAHSGQDACLAVIDALTAMPQQLATESLLRAALFSAYEKVSHEATYALKSRSLYSYVPVLLSAMKMPILAEMDAFGTGPYLRSVIVLRQEGPTENYVLPVLPGGGALWASQPYVNQSPKRGTITTGVGPFSVNVEASNANADKLNAVLAEVLETTTEQQLGTDPSNWWSWWFAQNDYYEPPVKPDVTPVRFTRSSCFPAGTSVWTTSGPMQIENIKVGELVLAQDSETGELAYKPVIGTTIRPASPLIETHLGDTLIRSTRGHPFWVDGIGWQMAKELKAVQWLHTAHGPVQIDSAEPSDEAVCYNLVVADFHDYFVSDAKVLVHDNLLRGPTLATVPGLAEAK
jgi:tetratricopeptide (TPR) repeat protein